MGFFPEEFTFNHKKKRIEQTFIWWYCPSKVWTNISSPYKKNNDKKLFFIQNWIIVVLHLKYLLVNLTFLIPCLLFTFLICSYLGGRGEKCSFFGKFGVLYLLVTTIFRFAVLHYYRQISLLFGLQLIVSGKMLFTYKN